MPYKQFVEVGRLCVISYGQLADELCVIGDIIDQNRVIVDVVGGQRMQIPVKRLKTTSFKVAITKGTPSESVIKAAKKEVDAFNETSWGKRILAEKNKAKLNDFQRFKHQKIAEEFKQLVQKKSKQK